MDKHGLTNRIPLSSLVEALLFVSSTPISIGQLATALEETPSNVKEAVDTLEEQYKKDRKSVV